MFVTTEPRGIRRQTCVFCVFMNAAAKKKMIWGVWKLFVSVPFKEKAMWLKINMELQQGQRHRTDRISASNGLFVWKWLMSTIMWEAQLKNQTHCSLASICCSKLKILIAEEKKIQRKFFWFVLITPNAEEKNFSYQHPASDEKVHSQT